MFIADEGDLKQSMLLNPYYLGNSRSRHNSNISIRGDKVKIKVDEELIYKAGESGSRKHFFVIRVFNSLKKQIAFTEKSY